MTAKSSVRLICAALTCAVAVLVCACGGKASNTSPSSPSSPSSPTVPPVTGSPCGAISGFTGTPQTIYNGSDCTTQTASTSVVWLYLLDGAGSAIKWCSGTVIDSLWVLTAAHCLDADVKGVAAWPGSGEPVKATEFHAHPSYTGVGTNSMDVGVVKLSASLGRTPIPLLTSREATAGEMGVIAGWGNGVTVTDPAGVLRAGFVTISGTTSGSIQTTYSSSASNVCNGDSGGPLLLQQGTTWTVAGIISSTTSGCISGSSDFTKVRNSSVLNFILGYVSNPQQR